MSIRKTVVAGSFYPNSASDIKKYIDKFNSVNLQIESFESIKAIISPHAGYIYSGFTANVAYKVASKNMPKRVIVIGPSNRVYLEGASVALYDEYETPLGNINIDLEYSKILKDEFDFLDFNVECEFEHSTETQMPFIKHYFPTSKIIEIVYGRLDYKQLSKLIDKLLEDKDNLIVISTDLSHFYSQEKANRLDSFCIEAVEKKDMALFDTCEACGEIGVKALVNSSITKNLKTKVLHYCTSADITDDKENVVGYASAIVGE